MRIDLHSHTTASDGGLSPQELIMRAENRQLDVLAITDHDTTAGVAEALSLDTPVKVIAGVEISCAWHAFDIHVVGLNFDVNNSVLQQRLSEQRDKREQRAQEMGRRLEKAGIDNIYSRAKTLAQDAPVTRSHFARALVEKGHAPTFNRVFDKYLGRGKTGYVPNNWMTIPEAIETIQQAGGVAVLAHPTHYRLSNKWLRKLISEFASAGGDGLEVGLPQLSLDQTRFMAVLCQENQLLASQGSDFHNPSPWRDLGKGIHLADGCQPIWNNWGLE